MTAASASPSSRLPIDSTSLVHLDRFSRELDLPLPPGYDREALTRWCDTAVARFGTAIPFDYVALEDIERTTMELPPQTRDVAGARVLGPSCHAFTPAQCAPTGVRTQSATMGFHRLKNVRLFMLGSLGPVVLDAQDRVIRELSTFYAPLLAIYAADPRAADAVTRHERGSCIATLDRFWEANYAHWMLDGMSRLAAAGLFELDDHRVVTTGVRRPWQRQMLAGFGVEQARHIDLHSGEVARFDDLIVSTDVGRNVPHPGCRMHPLAVQQLATPLASLPDEPASRTGNDVLLVVRSDNRRLENSDRLAAALLADGFQVTLLDCATVPVTSQWEQFARASIIVGVHGAALANAVFMRCGSTLVELMPPSYGNPEFWMIANARGAGYTCVTGVEEIDPQLRPQIRSIRLTDDGLANVVGACRQAHMAQPDAIALAA